MAIHDYDPDAPTGGAVLWVAIALFIELPLLLWALRACGVLP